MKNRSVIPIVVIALVVLVVLACSPEAVFYGLVGSPTSTPPRPVAIGQPSPTSGATLSVGSTAIPQSAAPVSTLTPIFTPTPTNTPTSTPTYTPTPTNTPLVYSQLIMRNSKNCLGVQNNQAVQVPCNSGTRLWNLPVGNIPGYFQLQLQNSTNCLSASSAIETEPFILKSCQAGDDMQLWQKRMSGGYFQLVNKSLLTDGPTNGCIDLRQWEIPDPFSIQQWPCKPWGNDNQIDNQLFCQTTTVTDTCAPPPGVYVTNIQQAPPPYSLPEKPRTFLVFFNVTFSNSTGQAQTYSWFVKTFGQNSGQTTQQVLSIPSGTSTVTVGPWNIGVTCASYTAKAIWQRSTSIDGLYFAFKNPSGQDYILSFPVRTDPNCP